MIKSLAKQLKPHQIEGVRFIWDNVAMSIEKLKTKSDEVSHFLVGRMFMFNVNCILLFFSHLDVC